MLLLGLTGGIAAGKSTVAARLSERGAVVIDSDALAREVVRPGSPGLARVVDRFGTGVRDADEALDRARLGRTVFADPQARADLNAIIHPLVRQRFAAIVAVTPAGAVVVHDVPLLVELGMGPQYHLVAVVGADADERVRRLMAERGMSPADARARLAAQATDQARRAAADIWLDNSGSGGQVRSTVDLLWRERLEPYAANLAAHRRSRGPDVPILMPHDRAWTGQAARLSARIRWLCRDHRAAPELRVDHIGSTAVAGIRAKPVIDLQLAVPSFTVADELEPALGAGGFVQVPGVPDDPKPADPDPEHWRKRFYGGADPGMIVHLHVRATGSPGWRYALLVRDWLRSQPAAVQAYEAQKLRLAGPPRSTAEYAGAKQAWFNAALGPAEAWATATGWAAPTRG